jgi:hypothetical protein
MSWGVRKKSAWCTTQVDCWGGSACLPPQLAWSQWQTDFNSSSSMRSIVRLIVASGFHNSKPQGCGLCELFLPSFLPCFLPLLIFLRSSFSHWFILFIYFVLLIFPLFHFLCLFLFRHFWFSLFSRIFFIYSFFSASGVLFSSLSFMMIIYVFLQRCNSIFLVLL